MLRWTQAGPDPAVRRSRHSGVAAEPSHLNRLNNLGNRDFLSEREKSAFVTHISSRNGLNIRTESQMRAAGPRTFRTS